MTKFTGWFAVALALLSLAPSFIPGAISIMGLLLSLLALFISLYSVIDSGKKYFHITLFISTLGALFVNDAMRIWKPLAPADILLMLYGMFALAIIIFITIAHYFDKPDSKAQHSNE